jgi:hypothetical protein
MLRRVALVRTDVSEELSASFIRVTRIGELATDARCEEIPIPENTILRFSHGLLVGEVRSVCLHLSFVRL